MIVEETLAIVYDLALTEEQRNDVDAIIRAIKRHIDGRINESIELLGAVCEFAQFINCVAHFVIS